MIHPKTELRFISPEIGYGVFAIEFIPKGTIIYTKDLLEIEFTENEYKYLDFTYKSIVDKYSYMDKNGIRILSWDHARFMNHSCDCNSLSTGYEFEIAIRDILAGEEITDDYGLLNLTEPMEVSCKCINCRKTIQPNDIDIYYKEWDAKVKEVISLIQKVNQPLWQFIDKESKHEVLNCIAGFSPYKSVKHLKLNNNKLIKNKLVEQTVPIS